MKIKTILVSMLAVAALAGCNTENGDKRTKPEDADVAYLSIKIDTHEQTRSSGEDPGFGESALNTLYLLTFNDAGKVMAVPGTSVYYVRISPASATPEPVKIAAASTKLLAVANPGTDLEKIITNTSSSGSFTTINQAINGVAVGEVKDATKGFGMINSGNDEGLTSGGKITDPLIDISDKIQTIAAAGGEQAAIDAAKEAENQVEVKIERFASKISFKLKGDDNNNIVVSPAGAKFTFGNWTIDAVNTAYYPFAEKTIINVAHTPSPGFYNSNFYTQDPNFTGTVGDGIANASVNALTRAPELVAPYTWLAAPLETHCLENTMAAAEQTFGNTTRVVVKGTYYPAGYTGTTGDWFHFANKNYLSFADLQEAYDKAATGSDLKSACDDMYAKIAKYAQDNSIDDLEGTSFATLTVGDLAKIDNGGEVLKEGKKDIIRWYKDGLCYYYYEIRHNNETTVEMDFAKYGVVRNNWYSLTLGTVGGPGTPWYPDIDNPGPGDPDPETPIDQAAGYLGITVTVGPWILWENEIGI